jgi:uncharacterized protein (DUF58 family)
MAYAQEFHYRLPRRVGGHRPGSHPGASLGAGHEFVSHMRLYDRPDPRRLDLRASLRQPGGDWLVRTHRQRASIVVHAVVDVSASMGFGSNRTKLHVIADFVDALGVSAFRLGDAFGMSAFDAVERTDLYFPAMLNRGIGGVMADALRNCACAGDGMAGLQGALQHLVGRQGLVFLLSDFHWPVEQLEAALELLNRAFVVPVIVWDPAEIEPPASTGFAALRDAESGRQRTLWLRPKLRQEWRDAVATRRALIERVLAARAIRPFYIFGNFDSEAMSRYFFEASA